MAARSRSRSRRRTPRHGHSDLLARVLVALPAIAFAVFIIVSGGWIFTAGAVALGLLCMHELFRMYEDVRPVKLAAFAALAGLAVAAQVGDERQVLMAAVAFVPVMFLVALAMPPRERRRRERERAAISARRSGGRGPRRCRAPPRSPPARSPATTRP